MMKEIATKSLNLLRSYMDYYVDELCKRSQAHYRIIFDIPIPFPQKYDWINYDRDIELCNIKWNEHPHKAWEKPDKEFLGVEIRYYARFKPKQVLTFEQFCQIHS